jgi:hypothetical protein
MRRSVAHRLHASCANGASAINIRSLALGYGIVFLGAGIAAFFPALLAPDEALENELLIPHAAGEFLGLFHLNALHNVGHAAAGVWGLLVYRNPRAALAYVRALAVGLAVVAVLGLVPRVNTLFGLVPLHGHIVWFHAALAVVAAYFGFVKRA